VKLQIAVIGSAGPEEYDYKKPNTKMYAVAEDLGAELAKKNCIVLMGGKGGIMESAAKGAKMSGGITAGEVSGIERGSANKYVDIEVVTGDLALRGPSQLIGMCDGAIAIGGGAGTLQELAVAYRLQKPVVLISGYGGWTDKIATMDFMDERRSIQFLSATSAKEAVQKLLSQINVDDFEVKQ
jgi:uncharacterized protein (TIGR00725 family)